MSNTKLKSRNQLSLEVFLSESKNEYIPTTIENIEEIIYKTNDLSPAPKDAGGGCQERGDDNCIRPKERQHFSESDLRKNKIPFEGRKVTKYYEELKHKFSRFDCPIKLDPQKATFDDVALHALLRQRLSPSTVEKRMRYARYMETHPVPVDFRNPSLENFIKHMDYREQVEFTEREGIYALQHEWKTMKTFLRAYGMPIWDYKPPSVPKSNARYIPLPDTVYKMIHTDYTLDTDKDDYANALVQYTLTHSFVIGWRNPSEVCAMTLDNINLDEGTIVIIEPKKHYCTRMIAPEYSILDGKNRKSFKYWIDKWRPKVENSKSGNALYLNPQDGTPIQIDQYRSFMIRRIKPLYPKFTLYATRHWCAIARLIRSKLKTGTWDTLDVRNWLGHTNVKTTVGYLRDAEQYMKLAPYDWFQRVLKFQKYKNKKMEEENTLKISTRPKKRVLVRFSPRSAYGPEEI